MQNNDVTPPSDDNATGNLSYLYDFWASLTLSLDPALSSDVPLDAEQIAKNVHNLKSRARGRGRGRGRGGLMRTDSGSGRDSPHASEYVASLSLHCIF